MKNNKANAPCVVKVACKKQGGMTRDIGAKVKGQPLQLKNSTEDILHSLYFKSFIE